MLFILGSFFIRHWCICTYTLYGGGSCRGRVSPRGLQVFHRDELMQRCGRWLCGVNKGRFKGMGMDFEQPCLAPTVGSTHVRSTGKISSENNADEWYYRNVLIFA